jgi:hypothetical protein
MRRWLLVKLLFKFNKKRIEVLRCNHGPRNNLQFSSVKMRDEISVLLVLNYLLEFE